MTLSLDASKDGTLEYIMYLIIRLLLLALTEYCIQVHLSL